MEPVPRNHNEDDPAVATPTLPPSSVVGSTRAPTTDIYWRQLLEQQNQITMRMIEAMQGKTSTPTSIKLPEFNPDLPDVDPRSWSSTVDICLTEHPMEGGALIISLSKSLKGSASTWLSQVSHIGMTWPQFKNLFLARYDCAETCAATIINANNSQQKDGENLTAYASRLMTSLLAKWKEMSCEEIAVSYVLAHLSKMDSRINRLAFTTEIKTRTKLIQELNAFSLKRKHDRHVDNSVDTKRPKASNTPFQCNYCHKIGHKAIDCRLRRNNQAPATQRNTSTTTSSSSSDAKKDVTCFRCGERGHIAPRCPKTSNAAVSGNTSSNSGAAPERRVNYCQVQGVRGQLTQSGEPYMFYFDSGAECSLVKQSIADKFLGERSVANIRLTGVGNAHVYCNEQIVCDVIINGHCLHLSFLIVPDEFMPHNIMLGSDILNYDLSVTLSRENLMITKPVSCFAAVTEINFNSINTDVSPVFRDSLVRLLSEFSFGFIDGLPLTRVTTGDMKIRLKDPTRTVYRRPYRLSPRERDVVRNKVNELLNANTIRPSSSPFASPILLVAKRDGSERMVIDYRELNSNTVPDRFPLPRIDDQIARLNGANYFTCLDCASGFNQIPILDPESIERTAFITPDGQFEYLAMPFGLRNAPSVFQRAVSNALGPLAFSYAILYLDDILIPSTSVEEGLTRLREVLTALTEAGFSLNLLKCSFLKQRVEFLGYDISSGQIRPNPRKVEALSKLPPPENSSQLRQFIGLASYFRKFVKSFSLIMLPLFHLNTSAQFNWKPEHEEVRQKIISVLTDTPVLTIFDPEVPVELHTDASAIGYGGILFQQVDGQLRVVEYYSRRTTDAESRYHSYELETLAVVNAVKRFHHYLQGRHFVVVTDCNSLKASHNKVDLSPRVHRYWAFLQAYDFEIVYREGKRMSHVDFFSRNPLPELPVITKNASTIERIEQKRVDLTTLSDNWLLAEQLRDDEIQAIVIKLKENQLPTDIAKTYELRSGVLHRKIQRNNRTRCLPIVPRAFRWSVINHIHESIMHLGADKTLEKVYEHYWFDSMATYVRKFVDNCITCKVSKSHSGRIQAELHPIPKITVPWHTVHADITGKLSGKNDRKEYVIVLIDAFTKYVLLYHTLRIDTNSVVKALKSSVSLFGTPSRVIADQGRCFASNEFKQYCSSHNINLHLIATGSSRANGQVERVMSTLKSMLTAVETSHRSWQDALDEVQLALNCTVNRVTKASPLELMIGRVARPLNLLTADDTEVEVDIFETREHAAHNIERNSSYEKSRFDSNKAKLVKFNVGDMVLIQNEERNQTKLDPKYKGPFQITDVLEGDRYALKSLTSNRTYKYAHDRLRKMPQCEIPSELIVDIESNVDNDSENMSNVV